MSFTPNSDMQSQVGSSTVRLLDVPDLPDLIDVISEEDEVSSRVDESTESRLERWKRKLLDLTLRNRLLNFKQTVKTIHLLCPDLGELEDALAGGDTFRVLAKPRGIGEDNPRDADHHHPGASEDSVKQYLRAEMKVRRLHTDLMDQELDKRLLQIYRATRLSQEETGANTLFLALGMLAWRQAESSDQEHQAPILLVPVELERASVKEGFRLALHDDDPQFNVTLLQKLESDFDLRVPGLEPLPEDSSGVDVPKVFRLVREAIRGVSGWEVREEAYIGFFSFTKHLMWKDLQDRAALLTGNAVVDHLVNHPHERFDPEGAIPDRDRLDVDREPAETFCPLDADSSQLAAVFASADGRSFVLEGPPGTGKSQTITNMIAQSLAAGKTVLFVSEKMAALNVVYQRLIKVGLGDYCLQLHSNKTKKTDVLNQLANALRGPVGRHPDAWEREAGRLKALRDSLNEYASRIHNVHNNGLTVYEATSRLCALQDVPRVELGWDSPTALDREEIDRLHDRVARLATAGRECRELHEHPWVAVRREEFTLGWKRSATNSIQCLQEAAQGLCEAAKACGARLGLAETGWSLRDLEIMHDAAGVLLESPVPPAELLTVKDWPAVEDQVQHWIVCGRVRDVLRNKVATRYTPRALELNLEDLAARWSKAERALPPMSWLGRRAVRRALAPVRKDSHKPDRQDVAPDLAHLAQLKEKEDWIRGQTPRAKALLGRMWADGYANWQHLEVLMSWVRKFRTQLERASGGDGQRFTALKATWAQLVQTGSEPLRPDGLIGRDLFSFRDALQRFADARGKVEQELDLDAPLVWGTSDTRDVIFTVRETAARWLSATGNLQAWCAWRRARREALECGLKPLVEAYERGDLTSSDLARVFERSFLQWWHEAVTENDESLKNFFSPEHERKIQNFRELDCKMMELATDRIQAELASRVPQGTDQPANGSEFSILNRELQKKRRHMPVRKLLRKIPHVLPRIKPCLLMSPLSVAQFLDASFPKFDLVIFDEASQIPVWDAIGAIARGDKVIVVGDPKQLPPTNFFTKADEDEPVDEDQVEDLESILDDCIGGGLPVLQLDWHYRSRHESLITFSNRQYYANRLLTFPSPETKNIGVSLRRVDGYYGCKFLRTYFHVCFHAADLARFST